MCYILCMTSSSVCYVVSGTGGGLRGGARPPCEGLGEAPPKNFFCLGKRVTFLPHFSCRLDFHVHCWAVF
jgi:hypothetical protein